MSFQAYLDKAEEKTGLTPQQIVDRAHEKGFGPDTKAGEILAWLADDLGLGRGHGMALVHVIKNGAEISDRHVGTSGSHRDESTQLRLDGVAARSSQV
ncbi:DUF4287 domain-containing protein [Pedococcus ginsenosidimutans]|uniref:DUF4287 domain-containing protein n=1 Tax=Pedococcus ginsenosidimutans TaxID=490570 RepID=A0ABP8XSD6_9MICO